MDLWYSVCNESPANNVLTVRPQCAVRKGICDSSATFLDSLNPSTATMSSNLGMDVAYVGATFAFAATNRTVIPPSLNSCRT